jgi:hypothetical protein
MRGQLPAIGAMNGAFQTRILAAFALAFVLLAVVSVESWRSAMRLVVVANAVQDAQPALTRQCRRTSSPAMSVFSNPTPWRSDV